METSRKRKYPEEHSNEASSNIAMIRPNKRSQNDSNLLSDSHSSIITTAHVPSSASASSCPTSPSHSLPSTSASFSPYFSLRRTEASHKCLSSSFTTIDLVSKSSKIEEKNLSAPSSQGRVSRLPHRVIEKVRSQFIITSLAQVVDELCQNSIDAKSTVISVSLNIADWTVSVSDNGWGIPRDNLRHVGNRYSTSKCFSETDLNDNLTYYGFRGEALSSISQCSLVEIVTRHRHSTQTLMKFIKEGDELAFQESPISRPAGTQITVKSLFYNMPVKRKMCEPATEKESCRKAVITLALANPEIEFSLHDVCHSQKLLDLKKAPSLLRRFEDIFGKRRGEFMAPADIQIAVESTKLRVSGILSVPGRYFFSKEYQYVFVNGRYITATRIHKEVNKLLKDTDTELLRQGDIPLSTAGKNGRKRYPAFVLNVDLPPSEFDITFDPRKTDIEFRNWSVVLAALSYLVRENSKASGLADLTNLDERGLLSENESGITSEWGPIVQPEPHSCADALLPRPCIENEFKLPHLNAPVNSELAKILQRGSSPMRRKHTSRSTPAAEKMPSLKNISPTESSFASSPSRLSTGLRNSTNLIPLQSSSSAPSSDSSSSTVNKVLNKWKNPVFSSWNLSISKIQELVVGNPLQSGQEIELSKEMLKEFEVINQLGKIGKIICVVDQHAADERIRFESFMKDIYGIGSGHRNVELVYLSDCVMDMSSREIHLMDLYRGELESWGWSYTLPSSSSSFATTRTTEDKHRVELHSAPRVLGKLFDDERGMKEYLAEMEKCGGTSRCRPPAIHRLLQSRACRGAVMFGDALSKTDCKHIISKLSECDTPFSCAHGRPSIYPLVDLSKIPPKGKFEEF